MTRSNFFNTLELRFLDLFIYILSHPWLVYFCRGKSGVAYLGRQIFFYGMVFSVFCIMGFISGYVYLNSGLFR